MSILNKLKKLKLPDDTMLTLKFEEGADVFHFNETEIETALTETTVVSELATLVANSKLDAQNSWYGNILQHLRDNDYLEDYERGTFEFEDFLTETLTENFYDHELIEYSTEKYDHKRGFTTLTAEVQVPYANFVREQPHTFGWTISVETDGGTLTFK